MGSVVREGVRMGALSSVGDERLFVMEVIVEVVVRAQVNYIKQVSVKLLCLSSINYTE